MILNNVRLLPELSGGVQTDCGSVEIQGGKIVKVSAEPVSCKTADEEIFDLGGKTLLPGLIDLHTHITMLGGAGEDCIGEPMKLLTVAVSQAQKALTYGFTTLRDCGSIDHVAIYARDMINKGIAPGPRILATGETITSSIAWKPGKGAASGVWVTDGAEEYRRNVRREAVLGADHIKIYASGSAYDPTGVPKHPIMTRDEIRTAVETAEMCGLYVASHCHADSAIRDCIECGVKTIEHATYLSDETIALLQRTEGCYLVPTLAAMYVSQTDPEQREFWLARLTPMLEACAGQIEKVYRKGEKMGFGTDSAPGSVQYEKGVEFQMRKDYCHMENIDILLQATKYNAEIAGIDHIVGEIKEGLIADLILVDGNPAEDISVMYHKPEKVFQAGKLV